MLTRCPEACENEVMTFQRYNFTIMHKGTAKVFHARTSREDAAAGFQRAYGYHPADEAFVWVERYKGVSAG